MPDAHLVIRIGRRERSRRVIETRDLEALAARMAEHIPLIIEQERAQVAVLVDMPDGITHIIGRYPPGGAA